MKAFLRLLATVIHLKPIQIVYQFINRIRPRKPFNYYRAKDEITIQKLAFSIPVYTSVSRVSRLSFSFLNIEHNFSGEIDWGIEEHGKLWNYNLQYLIVLHQPDVELYEKIQIVKSLYEALENNTIPLEPYPVSLRSINIIRFIHEHDLHPEEWMLKNLYAELNFLANHFEYHLLGNHLLENAFALMMGGAYFQKQNWIDQAIHTLKIQLKEQIHADGGHFELSPMYHSIIFYRTLELWDWYRHDDQKDSLLFNQLQDSASSMKGWLEQIKFENGNIPHFNDSADGITFQADTLLQIANSLSIESKPIPLSDSGYRKYKGKHYECIVDAGPIGASYQPGHAHADALSFILHYKNKPFFVELGTSTYEHSPRRDLERSTGAHNTVVVDDKNQSDVWGAFRVGKRARVRIHLDEQDKIEVSHYGYTPKIHRRLFNFSDHEVMIYDVIENQENSDAIFHLHLAPGVKIFKIDENEIILDNCTIQLSGAKRTIVENCLIAEGLNKVVPSKKIEVTFQLKLTTKISLQ